VVEVESRSGKCGKGRGVFVDMTRHAPGLSARSHEEKVPLIHALAKMREVEKGRERLQRV